MTEKIRPSTSTEHNAFLAIIKQAEGELGERFREVERLALEGNRLELIDIFKRQVQKFSRELAAAMNGAWQR